MCEENKDGGVVGRGRVSWEELSKKLIQTGKKGRRKTGRMNLEA